MEKNYSCLFHWFPEHELQHSFQCIGDRGAKYCFSAGGSIVLCKALTRFSCNTCIRILIDEVMGKLDYLGPASDMFFICHISIWQDYWKIAPSNMTADHNLKNNTYGHDTLYHCSN